MTYSIIARDPDTGALGVATATGSVAVGGFVPHARSGAGAVATQGAFTNWLYGERGLNLMAIGVSAARVREQLLEEDPGMSQRQFILCDREGNTAGHTGSANLAQMAHYCGEGVATAGNMLADRAIPRIMMETYLAHTEYPFTERLIRALVAGADAGGDLRGTRSAAVTVSTFDRPPMDLRVDWAYEDCISRLWQVYEKTQEPAFISFLAGVPTRAHPTKTGHVKEGGVNP
tara:strand:+ start:7071 stop:7763 length:693 start_codon:yes stop_codon:yes gene_type:complete